MPTEFEQTRATGRRERSAERKLYEIPIDIILQMDPLSQNKILEDTTIQLTRLAAHHVKNQVTRPRKKLDMVLNAFGRTDRDVSQTEQIDPITIVRYRRDVSYALSYVLEKQGYQPDFGDKQNEYQNIKNLLDYQDLRSRQTLLYLRNTEVTHMLTKLPHINFLIHHFAKYHDITDVLDELNIPYDRRDTINNYFSYLLGWKKPPHEHDGIMGTMLIARRFLFASCLIDKTNFRKNAALAPLISRCVVALSDFPRTNGSPHLHPSLSAETFMTKLLEQEYLDIAKYFSGYGPEVPEVDEFIVTRAESKKRKRPIKRNITHNIDVFPSYQVYADNESMPRSVQTFMEYIVNGGVYSHFGRTLPGLDEFDSVVSTDRWVYYGSQFLEAVLTYPLEWPLEKYFPMRTRENLTRINRHMKKMFK